MAKLLTIGRNPKKLVRFGSKLSIDQKCCCVYVLIIWNSNQLKDDNFDVSLNSNLIGTINNNSNTCTGRIWCEDTNVNASNLYNGSIAGDRLFCDGSANFESTLSLNRNNFIQGTNTFNISSNVDNGNGNAGSVWFGLVARQNNNTYKITSLIISSNYGSFYPMNSNFSFIWPQ